MATKELNDQQLAFVAAYLGDARRNATLAAKMAGYQKPRQAGSRLLSNVVIQREIAAWREQVKSTAIADMTYRLERLSELEQRYWQVVDARASDLSNVPGGESGLLVRQHKIIGHGEDSQFITEYSADTAVTREMRELYKQAAQELGQWINRSESTGKLSIEVQEAAKRIADELGMSVDEVLAEAEAIVRGTV